MSQTKQRLALHEAKAHAKSMELLAGADKTHTWIVAGSIRRECESVGDIEHVVIPRFGDVEKDEVEGLFASTTIVPNQNLLFHRLDVLLASGRISKATDAGGRTCWGTLQRACMLDGVRHEFYTAGVDNIGPQLAIRTGPADLSHHLVMAIKRCGYECRNGFHVYPLNSDQMISVTDEEEFFKICGVRFCPPRERDVLWDAIKKTKWREREEALR